MTSGPVDPWCATAVDSAGYKVDGAFIWCKDGCPNDKGYLDWLDPERKVTQPGTPKDSWEMPYSKP